LGKATTKDEGIDFTTKNETITRVEKFAFAFFVAFVSFVVRSDHRFAPKIKD
jgi:hypothetical protein